jgi:hypothetical protein
MEDKEQLYVIEDGIETPSGDVALASYQVNITSKLSGPVIVTYTPVKIAKHKEPVVIKLGRHIIEQLAGIPLDMSGVPFDVLHKMAHNIMENEKQGKSVLEQTVIEKKLIL